MKIILVSSLIVIIQATLEITNPYNISDYANSILNYSVSNFGHIPYGQTLTGRIFAVSEFGQFNYDLCTTDKLDRSTEFFKENPAYNKWLIVTRGNCPFTKKIINAQKLKASLVIVVDNKEELVGEIIMADDGNGYQVQIPSVLISKSDGKKILDLMKTYENQGYFNGLVQFNEQARSEKPQIILGLNIENRESFKLLREFKPYLDKLNGTVSFDIYYEILTCPGCREMGYKSDIQDCISGGRYCQLDPDDLDFGTGADVVREQLRQICLWQLNQTMWWNYMQYFDLSCTSPKEYKDCFDSYLPSYLSQKAETCVASSFDTSTEKNQLLAPNTILDDQFEKRYQTGIIFYPGASINYQAYRGNVEAAEIFEAICSSILIEPESCFKKTIFDQESQAEQNSYIWLIAFVIISCFLFVIFLIFILRRWIITQNQDENKIQIEEMVINYMKFYEPRQQDK